MSENPTYQLVSRHGQAYAIRLHERQYRNDSLAVTMECESEEYPGAWEPYATLTVNIEPESNAFAGTPRAFVDTNNLGDGIVPWLEENGIAHATGETAHSGYCEYPAVEFSTAAFCD